MPESTIDSSCSVRLIRSYEFIPGNRLFSLTLYTLQSAVFLQANYIYQGCMILKTALRLTVKADVSNNDSETRKNVAGN